MKSFNKFVFLVFALAALIVAPNLHANAVEMMKDSMMQKLTNTNIPIEIPLTKGYVKGSEVFYISTEASDKDLADLLTKLTGFQVAYTPALKKTPADALAQIYAFKNGIKGAGPLGFQPNVADSQPGDLNYSPVWAVNIVEWKQGVTPRELKSQTEILAAQTNGDLTVTSSGLIVNCPFVQWEGGSLQIRSDKTLTDQTPYGGGQVLDVDTEKMTVTFVAHRGFGPDGSTIYYIVTDASVKDVADMLGVLFVEKTGAALLSGASSDLYVFTNGIEGTGPMGFQASIGSTNVGDEFYSPLWRIQAATWKDPSSADFLTTASGITSAGSKDALTTEIAGAIVNCPFVQVDEKFMMEDKMMKDKEMMEKESSMMEKNNIDPPKNQLKLGVMMKDIKCKEGLELIFNARNWSPACVKPASAQTLMQWGWAASQEESMKMMEEKAMHEKGSKMKDESMMEKEGSMMEKENSMMEKENSMMEKEKSMMTKTIGNIDISMASPAEGSLDTSVTIIEFGDYQCPKCDDWFINQKPTVESNLIDTNKVKLYFVDFPFLGSDSQSASEATYCADEQGKYWEYHSSLYTNQGSIQSGWANQDALKQFAVDLGLDTAQFDECLDSGKYSDRVSHNKQVGISNGVEATPTFFIVGPDGTTEKIVGPQPASVFSETIEKMLS